MNRSLVLAAVLAAIASTALGCHRSRDGDAEDDEDEDSQDLQRTHYWRVQIAITGRGSVRDPSSKIDCTARETSPPEGRCGPELFAFEELAPPLLRATGAVGWRFDRWLSTTRTGPMPDGRYYVNGLGYRDTGVLERVTAVFVPTPDGPDDASADHPGR